MRRTLALLLVGLLACAAIAVPAIATHRERHVAEHEDDETDDGPSWGRGGNATRHALRDERAQERGEAEAHACVVRHEGSVERETLENGTERRTRERSWTRDCPGEERDANRSSERTTFRSNASGEDAATSRAAREGEEDGRGRPSWLASILRGRDAAAPSATASEDADERRHGGLRVAMEKVPDKVKAKFRAILDGLWGRDKADA